MMLSLFPAGSVFAWSAMVVWLISGQVQAQSIRFPWSGYAHDPQHDAIAPVASQPLTDLMADTGGFEYARR